MPAPVASPNLSPGQKIAALWQRNLPQVHDRLTLLDRTAQDAAAGTLAPELLEEATAIAHKFAGSLGMFGFHEGSAIARQIEQQLGGSPVDAALLAERTGQLRQSLFPTPNAP